MKKFLLLLEMASLCLIASTNASRVVGMSITYEYTGSGNDYIFWLQYNRCCAVIASPTVMKVLKSLLKDLVS